MANELRVVFDANVLISAVLLPHSIPRQAFDLASSKSRILISEATLIELSDVLMRPKFDRYVSAELRSNFLTTLVREADLVDVTESITECRDPKDNKYLELAVSGHATYLVTGDQDLLVMDPFRGISIVDPQTFLSAALGSEK